jgi:hypothetical protein
MEIVPKLSIKKNWITWFPTILARVWLLNFWATWLGVRISSAPIIRSYFLQNINPFLISVLSYPIPRITSSLSLEDKFLTISWILHLFFILNMHIVTIVVDIIWGMCIHVSIKYRIFWIDFYWIIETGLALITFRNDKFLPFSLRAMPDFLAP